MSQARDWINESGHRSWTSVEEHRSQTSETRPPIWDVKGMSDFLLQLKLISTEHIAVFLLLSGLPSRCLTLAPSPLSMLYCPFLEAWNENADVRIRVILTSLSLRHSCTIKAVLPHTLLTLMIKSPEALNKIEIWSIEQECQSQTLTGWRSFLTMLNFALLNMRIAMSDLIIR